MSSVRLKGTPVACGQAPIEPTPKKSPPPPSWLPVAGSKPETRLTSPPSKSSAATTTVPDGTAKVPAGKGVAAVPFEVSPSSALVPEKVHSAALKLSVGVLPATR